VTRFLDSVFAFLIGLVMGIFLALIQTQMVIL